MLKNSKSIKWFSLMFYMLGLACLGLLIYELVVLKGKYDENLAKFIGLGVGAFSFLLIGLTLSPSQKKILNVLIAKVKYNRE